MLRDVCLNQQVDQKAQGWRLEESRRRSIGADYAKSLGLQQTQDGKGKSQ